MYLLLFFRCDKNAFKKGFVWAPCLGVNTVHHGRKDMVTEV